MFETAIIRKHGQAFTAVDAGLLAETMLFYSNVHIVAQQGVLIGIITALGADTLIRLIDQKAITFTYLRSDYATVTVNRNGLEFHGFVAYHMSGNQKKPKITREEAVQLAFESALGKSWHTRRVAKRFMDKIAMRHDIEVPGHPRGIPELALADLSDAGYVRDGVRDLLRGLIPSYLPASDFRFEVLRGSGDDFLISHNLDFTALNLHFKESYPSADAALTPALLIGQLQEARVDLLLASRYMAEVVTSSATAAVIRRRLSAIMEKRDKNLSEIEMFQSTQLCNARAIREAINSGEHSFDEFLKVLERAEKFKEWLRSRNPDAALLDEYCKAIGTEGWIGKLPLKIARFFFSSGLGIALDSLYPSGIGTVSGLAISAADSLLLDRLIKGWRPNQFIEGPLRKLTS